MKPNYDWEMLIMRCPTNIDLFRQSYERHANIIRQRGNFGDFEQQVVEAVAHVVLHELSNPDYNVVIFRDCVPANYYASIELGRMKKIRHGIPGGYFSEDSVQVKTIEIPYQAPVIHPPKRYSLDNIMTFIRRSKSN